MAAPDLTDHNFLLSTFRQAAPLMPKPLAQQAAPGAMYGSPAAAQAAAGPNATPVQMYPSRAAAQTAAGPTATQVPVMKSRAAAQSAAQDGAVQALRSAYQKYLGRDIDDESLQAHLANPGGIRGALQTIANSPEAQAYRSRQSNQPTTDMGVPPGGVWNERPPAGVPTPSQPPTNNKLPMANPGTPFQYRVQRPGGVDY